MLKRYTFWLTAAVLFQFLTAILHSLSFLVSPKPGDEKEIELYRLMSETQPDVGAGFHPSFFNLFTALSACFPLLCLLGGLTLGYLLLKQADVELMRGVMLINLIIFGICVAVMAFLTFLPPIMMTALIVLNLAAAYVVMPKGETLN
jgi:hypothetical protein